MPYDQEEESLRRSMSETAASVAREYFRQWFYDRVDELNDRHFGFSYNKVRLKHNSSNWGSCSAKGNLNLNIRLLLTPVDVADYVIVHELAHLERRDHSKAYWRLVERAMPTYKTHERWLSQHGERCVF